ncbi:DUF397 domain-containing protein [Actinomadura sp. NPDC049382]|uniref:DUF397 domain-containing protein n=1 Tax=Actinomadura sp. NPDC049382 TaxID=3158220 RepID=UPI00341C7D16
MEASPRAVWRKSSYSGDGNNCVEVAALPAHVGVRDSKDPDARPIEVSSAGWRGLVAAVKAGEHDL